MHLARAIALALAASLSAITPARASGLSWQGALDVVLDRLAPIEDQVGAVREAVSPGTVLGAVQALALTADRADALPTSPEGAPPTSRAEAVAAIADAVRQADILLQRSHTPSSDLPSAEQVAQLVQDAVQDPHSTPALQPADPGPALQAAAIVASAVDAALPALRSGTTMTATSSTAPCDVLDQGPVCVSGEGPTRYEAEKLLTVDLGGNDVYVNSAGSAPLGGVGVVVDAGGDDLYAAPATYRAGQGIAVTGLGMLVDAGGSDTYRVEQTGGAVAQGYGLLGGVGILFDTTGNDRYTATASSTGTVANVQAQGGGVLGGVGALVDGGGDDTYVATATALPVDGEIVDEEGNRTLVRQYGTAGANAQGFGALGGGGLLADAGGKDSLETTGTIAPSPPEGRPAIGELTGFSAFGGGQGTGLIGGTGFLLTGLGSTTYSMNAVAGPVPASIQPVTANNFAQSAASVGGAAVLSDLGGDDTYRVQTSAQSSVSMTAVDGCACVAGPVSETGLVQVQAQAQALDGSVALMEDAGGADRYEAVTTNLATARVRDQRTAAASPIGGGADAGRAVVMAQGAGLGPGGLGVVRNGTGNASYVVSTTSQAEADGSATVPANEPILSSNTRGVLVDAQGAGVGSDLGNLVVGPGTGALLELAPRMEDISLDSYSAASTAAAVVNGVSTPGSVEAHVQGAADDLAGVAALGLAIDLDVIWPDKYTQSPVATACQGTRGIAVWVDCGTVGLGVNTG